MPFKVVPVGKKFKIYNEAKKKYVSKEFKTVEAAQNTITVYNNYERKKSLDITKKTTIKNMKGYK